MVDSRGVVISVPIDVVGDSLSIRIGAPDPIELRRCTLYWDLIEWPSNNVIAFDISTPDLEVLKSEGLLHRSHIVVDHEGPMPARFLEAHFVAFELRAAETPGAWSLSQNSSRLLVPGRLATTGVRVDVDLVELLPVPASDVPLEEVLRFKEARRPELLALRAALDELYLGITDSGDPERAFISAKDRILTASEELDRVLGERRIRRLLGSVQVSLDVTEAVTGAAIGAAGVAAGFWGAALGGVIAAAKGLKLTLVKGGELAGVSDAARDFAYIGLAAKELK